MPRKRKSDLSYLSKRARACRLRRSQQTLEQSHIRRTLDAEHHRIFRATERLKHLHKQEEKGPTNSSEVVNAISQSSLVKSNVNSMLLSSRGNKYGDGQMGCHIQLVKEEVRDDMDSPPDSYLNYLFKYEVKKEGSVYNSEERWNPDVDSDEAEVQPPLSVFLPCYDDDDVGSDKESEEDCHVACMSSVNIKKESEIQLTGLEDSNCDLQPEIDDDMNLRKKETYTSYQSVRNSTQEGYNSTHLRIHCEEKTFQCIECEMILTSKSTLKRHMKIHNGGEIFRCSECEKCFPHPSNLFVHMRVHTKERPFQCDECGKSFSNNGCLVRHARIHTGEKPFHCDECGKFFSSKGGLVRHTRIHTGEKPYNCDYCKKCFGDQTHLVKHMRVHTGKKPFHCAECDKKFSQKSILITHMITHTGEKPFHCSECEKCFALKSNLDKHMRVHTGEKPFHCRECGKSFSDQSNLIKHAKTHTGEKSFHCHECKKSFARNDTLITHMKVHTEEKTFCC